MGDILSSALGSLITPKLNLPAFTPINVGQEQTKAIANNQSALGAAENLGTSVNAYNQAALTQQLQSLIPGLSTINQNVSSALTAETAGQLPPDVVAQIGRSGAASALQGGYGGSQRQGNLTARDLGLNSLQLQQQGMDAASRWIANAKATQAAPTFDATSMFVTPGFQTQVDTSERNAAFQYQLAQNQLNVAQSPWTAVGNAVSSGGSLLPDFSS